MKKIILLIFLLPNLLISQVGFDSVPMDLQLVPRDPATNLGEVIISGTVQSPGASYVALQTDVYRDGVLINSERMNLSYVDDVAHFEFAIDIQAELANYDFRVYGDDGNQLSLEKSVDSVVSGDVFIIQGQSNAEARMRDNDSSSSINSDFIRVYANGTDMSGDLENNNAWYLGNGDGGRKDNGNTGQWGLKLARLINDNLDIPVAIFNAGHGPKAISFFLRPPDYKSSLKSNYGRLYYRLRQTGLTNHVKALIWVQGEQDGLDGTSSNEYINRFNSLYLSWNEDYPGIENYYIFQTGNGCGVDSNSIMEIKEAQRIVANSNSDVYILPTAKGVRSTDYCHFTFTGGYEILGERIFNLIGFNSYGLQENVEVTPPDILDAYLTDEKTLVIDTSADFLKLENPPASDFVVQGAVSVDVTSIEVVDNKIILVLSDTPASGSLVSYLGPSSTQVDNLITNSNDLELLCFYQFPLDDSRFTVWNGTSWNNGLPNASKYVIFADDYDDPGESILAKNMTVRAGATVNYNTGTNNSIVVYGDLKIEGDLILGDQESLVMKDNDAFIDGRIIKIEQSTYRSNMHDFTYWSSPVSNESVEMVFGDVTPSRIFYYDQSKSSGSDPSDPTFWDIWQRATGIMNPAQGFASEGPAGQDGVHVVSFTGKPNNGVITRPLIGFFDDDEPGDDKGNNFNLIGNPYPSAINITDFFDENKAVIDETVYFWTHATPVSNGTSGDYLSSDYATYNRSGGTASSNGGSIPRDTIASGQGFFVRARKAGSITFTNSMRRADQNTLFFKSANKKNIVRNYNERDRVWLDLKSDQSGFSQILISFSDESSDGLDTGYDAFKFKGENPVSLYSLLEDSELVIQGLSKFTDDKIIRLGYESNVAPRNLSISLNKTEGVLGEQAIILVDRLLKKTHDLQESCYHFEQSEVCSSKDRFEIHFKNYEFEIEQIDAVVEKFEVQLEQSRLKIDSSQEVEKLDVFNLLGQRLLHVSPNRSSIDIATPQLRGGSIYYVNAILSDSRVISKKVVCQ